VAGTQRGRLEQLGQSAGQRGWWDAYSDTLGPEYTALIALEAEAESVRWYAPMLVPGLLQTEQYARAVISSGLLIAPPGEVERRVQVKMTRQRVLTRDNPLSLDVVLDEAAVLRTIGGAEIMREQLAHLVTMAARPNVTLQVLPLAAGAHPATTGEFTVLGFPDLIAPDVVYLENMTSDLYVEQEAEVYRYGLAFDRLRGLALTAGNRLSSSPLKRITSSDLEGCRQPVKGGAEVGVQDLRHAQWRISTHSANGSTCVEVARNLPGIVAVRDSKDRQGPVLTFTPDQWQTFIARLGHSASW
jgi:hypothetical protein